MKKTTLLTLLAGMIIISTQGCGDNQEAEVKNNIYESTKDTKVYELTDSSDIKENTKYTYSYAGGTDINRFTIENSVAKDCIIHILDTTNTSNSYSHSYSIDYSDYSPEGDYKLDTSSENIHFSLSWMYYTSMESHFDFYVSCEDSEIVMNDIAELETNQPFSMPSYVKEHYTTLYNVAFTSSEEYIDGAATFDPLINILNAQWYSYDMNIRTSETSGKWKETPIVLSHNGYATDGMFPDKMSCKIISTMNSSPEIHDVECNAYDEDDNVLITKTTKITGSDLTLMMDLRYIDINGYYYYKEKYDFGFQTSIPEE